MKQKQGFLTLIFVLFTCLVTMISILACIYSKSIFLNYNFLLKDTTLIMWLISNFLISILVKKKTKKAVVITSILFAILYSVQMMFIFNAYNFIEIQHYFNWGYDITYFEVMFREVYFDFVKGDFKYLTVFSWMIIAVISGGIVTSDKFKDIVMKIIETIMHKYDFGDDDLEYLDAEIERFAQLSQTTEIKSSKRNFRENPTQGKLNSRARAAIRKAKK